MKLTKTDLKLIPNMTNRFEDPIVTFQQHSLSRNWQSSSATVEKPTKPLHLQTDSFPVFGSSSNCITPAPSFEESERSINMSFSVSSETLNSVISCDRHHGSFGSIGLPSDYPSHTKSNSFASSIFSEDVDERFERMSFDLSNHEPNHGRVYDSPLQNTDESQGTRVQLDVTPPLMSPSASTNGTATSSQKRKSRHHRRRTEIYSTECYQKMVQDFNKNRRKKNQAICATDFHDNILDGVFKSDE